ELPIALGVGPQSLRARATAAGQEGRAHLSGCVNEGLVRLDLRQRLDASARLLLRILDEALQLIVGARTGRQEAERGARQRHQENKLTTISVHSDQPRSGA